MSHSLVTFFVSYPYINLLHQHWCKDLFVSARLVYDEVNSIREDENWEFFCWRLSILSGHLKQAKKVILLKVDELFFG